MPDGLRRTYRQLRMWLRLEPASIRQVGHVRSSALAAFVALRSLLPPTGPRFWSVLRLAASPCPGLSLRLYV